MAKRDNKGRFLKRGSTRRRKASRPKSRTRKRRSPAAPRKARAVAKKRRKRSSGGRRRSGGSVSSTFSARTKGEVAGAGAVFGYLTSQTKSGIELYAKAPKVSAIGKDGTMAVVAHFVAANSSGAVRKWADRLSVALAGAASVALGRVNFKGDQLAGMEGAADYLSGSIDGDEDGFVGGDDLSGEMDS